MSGPGPVSGERTGGPARPHDPLGGAHPAGAETGTIRVFLRDPAQMFNSIDPSPFVERDLDDAAERFIVSWARDLPARAPLALEVQVARSGPLAQAERDLGEAVHLHFRRRSDTVRRELRELLRRGRISLAIGLVFLTACVVAADVAATAVRGGRLADVVREGLTVAGWVAMWRPMEIFLYAWWPLAGDRRLYDRLSRMRVSVRCAEA